MLERLQVAITWSHDVESWKPSTGSLRLEDRCYVGLCNQLIHYIIYSTVVIRKNIKYNVHINTIYLKDFVDFIDFGFHTASP